MGKLLMSDTPFGPETVERCVTDSYPRLLLGRRFARERLKAIAKTPGLAFTQPSVLFMCVHNSGRSQISAARLRHLSGEFPKPWTDEVVEGADVIITIGCSEACPVIPGKRYEDCSLLHSTGCDLESARAARGEIREHGARLASTLGVVPQ